MTVLLSVGAAIVASATAYSLAAELARRSPLTRRNYRGLSVALGAGLAVPLAALSAYALLALLMVVTPESDFLAAVARRAPSVAALLLGFALLGLWDDISTDAARGWRAHVRALRSGEPSAGALKLLGGAAISLVIVAPMGRTPAWTLVGAAVVAMSANLWNLLDLRPGRACKTLALAIVPLLVVGGPEAPLLAGTLGAAAGFFPLDLRERTMLGDAGANAIGAVVGWGIVSLASDLLLLVAFALLAVLQIVGEKPGLSRLIEGVPPLRALDRAGRVRESI